MTGVILAGGENLRIPLLKGYLEINGARIIDSSIKLLEKLFNRVVIITNTPELYFYCGMPIIGDIIGQRGPSAGILSALLSTEADEIFVVACDMPFIKPELVRYMVDKYKTGNAVSPTRPSPSRGEGKGGGESLSSELWALGSDKKWDAVIPLFGERLQPLLGIYSKNIIGSIERGLNKGLRSIKDMLTGLNVLYINEEEVREIDPEGRSFVNINTIEDYEKIVSSQKSVVCS